MRGKIVGRRNDVPLWIGLGNLGIAIYHLTVFFGGGRWYMLAFAFAQWLIANWMFCLWYNHNFPKMPKWAEDAFKETK